MFQYPVEQINISLVILGFHYFDVSYKYFIDSMVRYIISCKYQ